MGGHKVTRHAFLPWVAGAMVAGATGAGIGVNLAWANGALDEHGRLVTVAALIAVAFAAHGVALAWRRWSVLAATCLLIGAAGVGAVRVAVVDRDWQALVESLGVFDAHGESIRKLVWVEGIVVSTPRADEFAYRDALIKCEALEEDTLAPFVPRTPSTRFNLQIDALLDGHGARFQVTATLRVIVEGTIAGCAAGDRIQAKGWLGGFDFPTNPGGFNSAAWSRMRGIAAMLSIPNIDLIHQCDHPPLSMTSLLARWRSGVDASLNRALGEQQRLDATALIAASTTGANWPGLRTVSKAFAASGVQHLVAISGFNFGILAACALWCIRKMKIAPRLGGLVLIILAILFIGSIESEVSSIRAALMGGTAAIVLSFGRSIKFGSLIGLTAIVIVLCDPFAASQPGFQLSFGAIFGLRYISPFFAALFHRMICGYSLFSTLLRRALEPLAAGLSAWVVTTPIIALHFGVCPVWCIPCTIALSPSFAAMVISSNVAIAAEPICRPIGYAAGWISVVNAKMILSVVRFCATLPGAATLGPSVQTITDIPDWRVRIDMVDVGNGSCYLVRSESSAVVFDCGSLGAPAVGSQTVVPALRALGVKSLDAVVISHPNLDHYGALPEVVKAFSVSRVLVTPQFIKWARRGAACEALRAVRASGTVVEEFARGDERIFGSTQWRVLHPGRESLFDDSNDGSLIIRISDGDFSILMVGDAAQEACRSVLESPTPEDLNNVTVFELPHHGSFRPGATALARRLATPIVLQSTGPGRLVKDQWRDLLVDATRLVTARDHACSIMWKDDGAVWIGRWTGLKYQWRDSGLWRAAPPSVIGVRESAVLSLSSTNISGDKNCATKDHDVTNGSTTSLLDLELEWARLNRDHDLCRLVFYRQWVTTDLVAILAQYNYAIPPWTDRWWNFYMRVQDGKSLGDFVDEPFRPPDFYRGRTEWVISQTDLWRRILRTRQRNGCWRKHLRLECREWNDPLG